MNKISLHINTVNTCKRLSYKNLPFYVILFLFFFSLLFMIAGCTVHKPTTTPEHHDQSPASQIIHLYQGPLDHFSAVRYGGCPMYPNCSSFALSAIEKHGALVGWMMTFDRLIRCGSDETRLSPEVIVDGRWKYIDTLEQNDFWWNFKQDTTTLIDTQPSEQSLEWGISIE